MTTVIYQTKDNGNYVVSIEFGDELLDATTVYQAICKLVSEDTIDAFTWMRVLEDTPLPCHQERLVVTEGPAVLTSRTSSTIPMDSRYALVKESADAVLFYPRATKDGIYYYRMGKDEYPYERPR